jgi:hypothetical protein
MHGIILTYKFWMCTSLYVYTSGVEPYAYSPNSLKSKMWTKLEKVKL